VRCFISCTQPCDVHVYQVAEDIETSDDALAKLLESIETLSWARQCIYPDPSYTQRGRHGGHDCAGIAVHTRAGVAIGFVLGSERPIRPLPDTPDATGQRARDSLIVRMSRLVLLTDW